MAKKNKKEIWYRQCTMTSPIEGGESVQTAWIPEQFAVIDRTIYFGKKTDNPDQLWQVSSVSDMRKPGSYLGAHERDYLTQRSASDI